MKWFLIALGVVAVILLIIYFWPVPNKDFSQLSDKVDPEVRQSLLDFRAQHPENTVTVDGRAWRYIAMGEGPDAILFLRHDRSR